MAEGPWPLRWSQLLALGVNSTVAFDQLGHHIGLCRGPAALLTLHPRPRPRAPCAPQSLFENRPIQSSLANVHFQNTPLDCPMRRIALKKAAEADSDALTRR